jgi:hypothetical protein
MEMSNQNGKVKSMRKKQAKKCNKSKAREINVVSEYKKCIPAECWYFSTVLLAEILAREYGRNFKKMQKDGWRF